MNKTPSTPALHLAPTTSRASCAVWQGDIKGAVDNQKTNLMMAAGVVGVVLVLVFFLLGRRSGKRKSTIVEIRRV